MIAIAIHASLNPAWAGVPTVRPDGGPAAVDCYVVVSDDCRPLFRLELGRYPLECHAFEEAVVWYGLLILGRGHRVHCVHLGSREVRTTDLGYYFASFHPLPGCLLVASGERVFRFGFDGLPVWVSVPVGLDGVVVWRVEDGVIEGEGEWDPPGGWRPFRLHLESGELC